MGGRVEPSHCDLEYMDGMNRETTDYRLGITRVLLMFQLNTKTGHHNLRERESRAIFPFNWMMTVRFFTLTAMTAVSHYIFDAILTR